MAENKNQFNVVQVQEQLLVIVALHAFDNNKPSHVQYINQSLSMHNLPWLSFFDHKASCIRAGSTSTKHLLFPFPFLIKK